MPMSVRKVWLLDPTAKPQDEVKPMAARHRELRGKRLGILDNTKSNADVLMLRMAELLQASYGVDDVVHRRKAHAAIGAGEDLLDELASKCDMLLLGSGD